MSAVPYLSRNLSCVFARMLSHRACRRSNRNLARPLQATDEQETLKECVIVGSVVLALDGGDHYSITD